MFDTGFLWLPKIQVLKTYYAWFFLLDHTCGSSAFFWSKNILAYFKKFGVTLLLFFNFIFFLTNLILTNLAKELELLCMGFLFAICSCKKNSRGDVNVVLQLSLNHQIDVCRAKICSYFSSLCFAMFQWLFFSFSYFVVKSSTFCFVFSYIDSSFTLIHFV